MMKRASCKILIYLKKNVCTLGKSIRMYADDHHHGRFVPIAVDEKEKRQTLFLKSTAAALKESVETHAETKSISFIIYFI